MTKPIVKKPMLGSLRRKAIRATLLSTSLILGLLHTGQLELAAAQVAKQAPNPPSARSEGSLEKWWTGKK